MLLVNKLRTVAVRFAKEDDGFVTMEWVALAAGVVVLGLGIAYYLMDATDALGGKIETTMNTVSVGTAPTAPTIDGQ
jgi:hypothetical protein